MERILHNDIYQTLDLWAKLSPSIHQRKSVASRNLPDKDSNYEPEDGIEGATEDVRMLGDVAKAAQGVR
jgi:hypothetical protein